MKFGRLVQKRMFFLTLIILISLLYFGRMGHIGFNKTIGWAWDLSNWSFFIQIGSWPLFIIGYGILALLRYRTNKKISILHLILIVVNLITLFFASKSFFNISLSLIILLFNLISIILFLINFVWTIRNKKSEFIKK